MNGTEVSGLALVVAIVLSVVSLVGLVVALVLAVQAFAVTKRWTTSQLPVPVSSGTAEAPSVPVDEPPASLGTPPGHMADSGAL